jgi:uncharacterized protein involved in outer membrane biogenesis
MRKFFIGIGILAVVLGATAVIAPDFIDWNRYKGEIRAEARAATGRDLFIDGDLSLSVLPAPSLSARNVRFANIQGGSAPDMVTLKSLDVRVRFWPLLQGRVEVDSITLVEPVILLERLADGRTNWEMKPRQNKAAASGAVGGGDSGGGAGQAIRLDDLKIRNGQIIWHDATTGTRESIDNISAQLSAGSLQGPFRVRGDIRLRGMDMSLEAAVGTLKSGSAAPVSLTMTLPGAEAKLGLSGGLLVIGAPPRFTGKIDASGKDLRRLIIALSDQKAVTVPAALAQPFRIRSIIQGSERGGAVDNIDIEIGGIRAEGGIKANFKGRPRIDTKLRFLRIDLDKLLAATEPAASSGGKAGAVEEKKQTESGAASQNAAIGFQIPELDATLSLDIGAITYNQRNMRDVSVMMALTNGIARLTKATALLPGGGQLSLTGSLSTPEARLSYQGHLETRADNLRAVLTWLNIDTSGLARDRLRKFDLSAEFRGDDQQLQVTGAKLGLDATRIEGAVALALRKRLAFGITLNVDKINLDAYFPKEATNHSPAAKKKSGVKSSAGATKENLSPLAALTGFDANFRLNVGSLIIRNTTARDIAFDGTLAGGVLTIRNASVRDIAGMKASIKGSLKNLSGFPVFKGSVSADARDIGELLRFSGVVVPRAAKTLGALRLRGKADASADKIAVDLSASAAGARLKLNGAISGLDRNPAFSGTIAFSHREISKLLRTLGLNQGLPKLGWFGVSVEGRGNLDKVAFAGRVEAAGGSVTVKGTGSEFLASPKFDLDLVAKHPSTLKLVRLIVPRYRPAATRIGPLEIKAMMKGGNGDYLLSSLAIKAGKLALAGSGKLNTAGPVRPRLTALFKAGVIDLNPFLSPQTGGAASASSGRASKGAAPRGGSVNGAGRYSAKPFDVTALGLLDADLKIAAKALLYRHYRIDNPAISTSIKDRVLAIEQLSGKMYDGSFSMTGRFDAKRTPVMEAKVTVSQANVGKALFEAAQFDIRGGITDLTAEIRAVGDSPRAMVRTLGGKGRFLSRDGVVSGFDLGAVSDRLKNLNRAADLLSLFGSAMGGGETKFTSLGGSFTIQKGVLKSNDIRLVATAGEGNAAGFADLPRWHMDFKSRFDLTEHPKAPPFRMRAVGAVDNPRRLFDFQEIQTYLLQRGVGSMLRKLFPTRRSAGQPPPTAPSQPEPQPQKPRVEDVIKDLFRTFGR